MKTTQPILSDQADAILTHWLATRPHAVLILGHQAGNQVAVAEHFVQQLQSNSGISTVLRYSQPTIDAIRDMQTNIRTVTPSGRIIVIEHMHAMKHEAMNALLKTLEEPQTHNYFVISAQAADGIPATIRSRVAELSLSAPSKQQFLNHYHDAASDAVLLAGYTASGGNVAAFERYVSGDTANIDMAKQILSEPVYERLQRVNSLGADREHAQNLLSALAHTVQYLLRNDSKQRQKWLHAAALCADSKDALTANASIKLTLTRLFALL